LSDSFPYDFETINNLLTSFKAKHLFDFYILILSNIFSDKTYNNEWENEIRGKIFETNVNYITVHNELYKKGERSYYLGINQFTDLVSINVT